MTDTGTRKRRLAEGRPALIAVEIPRSRLKRFRHDPRLQTVRPATIPLHSRDHFRLCQNLNSAHHGETHLQFPKKR